MDPTNRKARPVEGTLGVSLGLEGSFFPWRAAPRISVE